MVVTMSEDKSTDGQPQQPKYVISVPQVVGGGEGDGKKSRVTRKHVLIAAVSLVIMALVVVGVVESVRIFSKHNVEVLKYQLKLKDKDNNDVTQDVSTDTEANVVQYHVVKEGVEAWILQDFDKNVEVSKVKTDNGVSCYLGALNRTNAQEPTTIPSTAPTPGDDTPSTELVYKVSETPVKDISFLGNRVEKLCRNIPTYWMVPSCSEGTSDAPSNMTDADAADDDHHRSKRASLCASCRGYPCVCGCCSYVCGRFASTRYTWYYSNGRYYCRYYMYSVRCVGSLARSRCYFRGRNYRYPWA